DTRVAEIDKRLVAEFPDYATFSRPQPLSVEEVQAQLRSDEALVLLLPTAEASPTPEETFIWAVTKTDFTWARSALGTSALTVQVAALRKGLEIDSFEKAAEAGQLFDLHLAHELYGALLGPVADVIKDKASLTVVSSGSLTSLPFHLLVTDRPANATTTRPAM